MADRYHALAVARLELWTSRGIRCEDDQRGNYTLLRNYHELHQTTLVTARHAWAGLDTRDYLFWMVDHGGDLWMPTPDEQTEAARAGAQARGLRLPVYRAA